jgi:hypothetical protein
MIKTKTFINRFLISEILPILVLFIYMFTLVLDRRIFLLMIVFFLMSLYLSAVNFILTVLFYFIKLKKLGSLIFLFIVIGITMHSYYSKIHLDNADVLIYTHNKKSFLGQNIDETLIFLGLIINQLLVNLYLIIWAKEDENLSINGS